MAAPEHMNPLLSSSAPPGRASRARGSLGRFVRRLALLAPLVCVVALSPLAFAADTAPAPVAPVQKSDAGGISKIPPDPAPMHERAQWVFDLRYDKGDLYLVGTHKVDLGAPQETPRAMGRFAIELFEGPTLIERVRFDFPFLGAAEATRDAGGGKPQPKFEPKLTTRIGVMFPASSRGTRLELWDRASDQRWPLPWPPEESVARTSAKDAGPEGG